jgi:nucleoside-diphosphate-sugar epimerase
VESCIKIVVTGSSGFIGTNLVSELVTRGYDVLGLDIMPPKFKVHDFNFKACDIRDNDVLNKSISQFAPDYIIHLAARTDLGEKNKLSGYSANIEGVRNLMSAVYMSPSIKRCIITSSQLVCKVGYIPQDDRDYKPDTLYGKSKVITEKIVRENDGGGVEWCILRPTTIWGEGMSTHYQRFFKMIQKGQYFHISKRPLYKSYGYVGNLVYQYEKFMEAPVEQIHRKTFYIADYEPLALRAWTIEIARKLEAEEVKTCPELLARIAAKVGDIINFLGFVHIPFNSFRLNNILTEYIFDLSDTQKVCGKLPFTMENGVDRTVNWLRRAGIVWS